MKVMLSEKLAELHQFILQTFANTGHSPSLAEIQQQFSLDTEQEANQWVADMEYTKVIHRTPGDLLVTHAYPFSNEKTRYKVILASGVQVHAMCAIDALGIPFMLDTNAMIESECLHCQGSIQISIKNSDIVNHSPENLLIGYVPMGCCSTPATDQCPLINFFCSQAHFNHWTKNNPTQGVKFLNLEQGLEQGKRIFASMMNPMAENRTS